MKWLDVQCPKGWTKSVSFIAFGFHFVIEHLFFYFIFLLCFIFREWSLSRDAGEEKRFQFQNSKFDERSISVHGILNCCDRVQHSWRRVEQRRLSERVIRMKSLRNQRSHPKPMSCQACMNGSIHSGRTRERFVKWHGVCERNGEASI